MQEIAFFVLGALAAGILMLLLNAYVLHMQPPEHVAEVAPPTLSELMVADSTARAIRFESTEETREFVQRIYDELEENRQTRPVPLIQTHCPLCQQIEEEHDIHVRRTDRRGMPVLCAHHQRVQNLLDLELDMMGDLDDDNEQHERWIA